MHYENNSDCNQSYWKDHRRTETQGLLLPIPIYTLRKKLKVIMANVCIFCTHWENDLGAIIEYRFNCHCFGELQPFHNVVYMLFVSICNVFNSRKPFVNLHNDYEHSLCISFGLVRLWRLAMRTTITRNMESKRICALTHINSITHLSLNVICITQELFLFSIIAHLHKHNNNNAYAVLSSGWSSIWTPRMCVCLCVQ